MPFGLFGKKGDVEDDGNVEAGGDENNLKSSTAKQINDICKGLEDQQVQVKGKFVLLDELWSDYKMEKEKEQTASNKCIDELKRLVNLKDDQIIRLTKENTELRRKLSQNRDSEKGQKRANHAFPDRPDRPNPDRISYLPKRSLITVTCFIKKAADYNLNGADETFLNKVRDILRKSDIDLQMHTQPLPDPQIVLVLCGVVSRLGTDVDHALQGIHRGKNVILLLFHHKAQHVSLEVQSDRLLSGPGYSDLGGMVDLVFWKEHGVYDCPVNSAAQQKFIDIFQVIVPRPAVSPTHKDTAPCPSQSPSHDNRTREAHAMHRHGTGHSLPTPGPGQYNGGPSSLTSVEVPGHNCYSWR